MSFDTNTPVNLRESSGRPDAQPPRERMPLQIALTYVLVAGAWITFSDNLLSLFTHNQELFVRVSQIKGSVFVLTTGVLLYAMLLRYVSSRRLVENKLRSSDEQLRLALMAANQGLFDLNITTGEVSVNAEYAAMLEHDPRTFKEDRTSWSERLHPDDRDRVQSHLQSYVAGKVQEYKIDYRIRTRSGGWKWILSVGKIVERDADGKPLRLLGTQTDITERKQTEQKLVKLNRIYSVISQINQAIVESTDKYKLFRDVCSITIQHGKFRMAWIGLIEDQSHEVVAVARSGIDDGYLEAINNISLSDVPEGRGPTGRAVREARYVVSNDIERDPQMEPWREEALKRLYRSSIALPIKINGTVVGTFSIYAREIDFFDREEIALLEEVTADVSFALEALEKENRRKQADEALRESEESYHKLVSASPDAITETDTQGIITFASPKSLELFGNSSLAEVVGHNILEWVATTDHHKALANIQQVMLKGSLNDTEYTLTKKDGTQFTGEVNAAAIRSPDGSPRGLIFISRDITNRQSAEKQIRMLSRAVEQSPSTVVVTDFYGNIEYVNPKFTQLTGYTFEEALGKNPRILKSGATLDEEYKHLWQTINSGKEWRGEFLNRKRNGEAYWESASISPIVDDTGKITHFLAVKEDITERKRAEEEARLSGERFNLIARATNDAVWDWDIASNTLWWNETFYKTYGYQENELPTIDTRLARIHPDDRLRVRAGFNTAVDSNSGTWSDEYRFLHADGTYGYVLDRGFLVCDKTNEPVRMLGSMVDITSLKLAELDQRFLAEERDRVLKHLQIQFERMPIGYLLLDRYVRITEWNPACERIFGFSREEAVGKSPDEFIISASLKPTLKNFVDEVKQSGETLNTISENLTKDGRTIICEWFDTPLTNERSEYVGIMAMVQDITEKRNAEEQLSAALLYNSTIIDSSPIGIVTFKASGEVISANAAQVRLVGGTIEEVRKQNFRNFESWKNSGLLDSALTAMKTGHDQEIEEQILTSFGKNVWLSCRFVPFQYGLEPRLLALMIDITERKRAENALRESEERYRQIVETAEEGIWTIDKNGNTTFVNKKMAEMFGYAVSEMIGTPMMHFMDEEGKTIAASNLERRKAGFAGQHDFRFCKKNGSDFWAQVATNPILDEQGKYVGTLAMVTDINKRRLAEEELKRMNTQLRQLSAHLQSIREEERKRISREIHDELGQELTALKMEVSLMQKAASHLDKMEIKVTLQDHAASLIAITDSAIHTVRRIATELRPDVLDKLGLVEALQWHAKEFQKKTGIACAFESNTQDREYHDDVATAIFRIFQEALTNVARHAGATKVSAALTERESEIQLTVEDNGRGIGEERLSNSSSLGLLGIRERARLLHGNATITGNAGKGTLVTLVVPLHPAH